MTWEAARGQELALNPGRLEARSSRLPRTPTVFVAKPSLLSLLNRHEPLMIVRGPRGYGKTSLVSHWVRSLPTDVDVVWVSCRVPATDGDGSLWGLVLDGLRMVGLAPQPGDSPEVADTHAEVVRALSRTRRELCLVIDDFRDGEHLGAESGLIDLVQRFDNLEIVLCMRERALAETVVAATIDSVVLRPTDLLLTEAETAEMVGGLGYTLSADAVRALHLETAGWPALVRAVLSNGVTSEGDGLGAIVDLTAGGPFLLSAWQELRDRRLALFIQRTALLDEFTLEDARVCTGLRAPGEVLQTLVGSGVVVRETLYEQDVFRYLPVVRRATVEYLRTLAPRQFRSASRRAARALLARDQLEAALAQLMRAGLWHDCAQLIEDRWVQLVAQSPQHVAAVVDQMPSEVLEQHARLVIARDHLLPAIRELTHDVIGDQPTHDLDLVSVSPPPVTAEVFALPDVLDAMEQSLAQIASLRMTGDFAAAKEIADRDHDDVLGRVEQLQSDIRSELAPVLHGWALTRLLGADLPGALSAFREAVELAGAHDHPTVVREASVGAALACALMGYLRPAEAWLDGVARMSAEGLAGADDLADGLGVGWTSEAVRTIVQIERLEDGGAVGDEVPDGPGELWSLDIMLRAQGALTDGTHFQVLAELEAARARVVSMPQERSLREALVISASVDLYLALGHVSRARGALEGVNQTYEVVALARARTEFLAGDFDAAAQLCQHWLKARINGPRSRMDFLLLQAVAELARNRRYEAAVALEEAVAIFQATGLLRGFLKVPRAALAELAVDVPRVRTVLEHDAFVAAKDLFPTPTATAQLSERELQVLRSLAENASLAGVARSLYLSSNTVKTHLRSIYRKLGTHSSIETVERARELGLLGG